MPLEFENITIYHKLQYLFLDKIYAIIIIERIRKSHRNCRGFVALGGNPNVWSVIGGHI